MKKISILFVLICFGMLSSKAQDENFHPVLTGDSCTWTIPHIDLAGHWLGTIQAVRLSGDTFSLSMTTPAGENSDYGQLYSNEASNKLYFRNAETQEELLVMDLSLEVGDHFVRRDQYNETYELVVDSVYYEENRKHIRFSEDVPWCYYGNQFQRKCFIEGVGPNWGFSEKDEEGPYFFICKHEGSELYYSHPDTAVFVDCGFNEEIFIGVRDYESSNVRLYPNPASQSFVINFTEVQDGVKQVRIFDMLGKEVMSLENPSGNTINIANLPTGMYVVRVLGQGGKEYAVKLVKE